MKLFGAAPLAALAARAQGDAPKPGAPPSAHGPWPTVEKLEQQTQEYASLVGKAPLANGDAPDLLPRPRLPRARRK